MYCTNCGSKIDDNSLVCSECGEKVDTVENIQENQQVPNTNSDKKRPIIIGIILAFLAVLIFIGTNQSNKYKEVEGLWQRKYESSEINVIGDETETYEFDDKMVRGELSWTEMDYTYGLVNKRYHYKSSYNCKGMSKNQGTLVIEPFTIYLGNHAVKNSEGKVVFDYRTYNENGETYLYLLDETNDRQYTFKLIK